MNPQNGEFPNLALVEWLQKYATPEQLEKIRYLERDLLRLSVTAEELLDPRLLRQYHCQVKSQPKMMSLLIKSDAGPQMLRKYIRGLERSERRGSVTPGSLVHIRADEEARQLFASAHSDHVAYWLSEVATPAQRGCLRQLAEAVAERAQKRRERYQRAVQLWDSAWGVFLRIRKQLGFFRQPTAAGEMVAGRVEIRLTAGKLKPARTCGALNGTVARKATTLIDRVMTQRSLRLQAARDVEIDLALQELRFVCHCESVVIVPVVSEEETSDKEYVAPSNNLEVVPKRIAVDEISLSPGAVAAARMDIELSTDWKASLSSPVTKCISARKPIKIDNHLLDSSWGVVRGAEAISEICVPMFASPVAKIVGVLGSSVANDESGVKQRRQTHRPQVVGVLKCLNRKNFSHSHSGLPFRTCDIVEAERCAELVVQACSKYAGDMCGNARQRRAAASRIQRSWRRQRLDLQTDVVEEPVPVGDPNGGRSLESTATRAQTVPLSWTEKPSNGAVLVEIGSLSDRRSKRNME